MPQVKQMKCACSKCLCIVEVETAIEFKDRYYCSTACAEGTCGDGGCGHKGCNC